jgi:hypothetical protein
MSCPGPVVVADASAGRDADHLADVGHLDREGAKLRACYWAKDRDCPSPAADAAALSDVARLKKYPDGRKPVARWPRAAQESAEVAVRTATGKLDALHQEPAVGRQARTDE